MKIPHRARAIILAGAGIAGLGASLAFASATTWTVSPGGTDTASAATVMLRDTTTEASLTCASSHSVDSVDSGSGLSGNDIAVENSVSFSGCSGPIGTFSVMPLGTWLINAQSFSAGVATGTITDVIAVIDGPSCTATVSGTAAGTYSDGTGAVQVFGGSLHISGVTGCSGLLRNGDPATFTGTYVASPRQTVTSP